jgi:hypothetical protein
MIEDMTGPQSVAGDIGKLRSEGLGFENPRSFQTGGCYCDPSSIAALAASFSRPSLASDPDPDKVGFKRDLRELTFDLLGP